MSGPLHGITILDLTHMLSGPYGTMTLTDLGATTIKVEPLDHGEGTRALLATDPDYSRDGMGAYFMTLNRGKKSICLNLKSAEGKEIFYDLVRKADIVFDNFGAGVPKRLEIDHDTLAKINPKIITCSVTGFGETGPDTQRPAFDQVVQAMGGGMSITGLPNHEPVRAGIPIADLGGGIFGIIGVLAALQARNTTGKGQHIDVSMLDGQISLLTYMATMCLMSGKVPEQIGNSHFVHVPYNTYKTKDGYIVIACIGDSFYERFRHTIPRAELQNEEYLKQPIRYANREIIESIINEELIKHSSEYWLTKFNVARVPCSPVNNFAEALKDPQILARDMVVNVPLESGEVIPMPGIPMKFSESQPEGFTSPPSLGRDTNSVLNEFLGYGFDKLESLRKSKIIQ